MIITVLLYLCVCARLVLNLPDFGVIIPNAADKRQAIYRTLTCQDDKL